MSRRSDSGNRLNDIDLMRIFGDRKGVAFGILWQQKAFAPFCYRHCTLSGWLSIYSDGVPCPGIEQFTLLMCSDGDGGYVMIVFLTSGCWSHVDGINYYPHSLS